MSGIEFTKPKHILEKGLSPLTRSESCLVIGSPDFCRFILMSILIFTVNPLFAQQQDTPGAQTTTADKTDTEVELKSVKEKKEATAREQEASMNEDPEAQRRSIAQDNQALLDTWPKIDFYGSVRLHGINHFDDNDELTDIALGDGASRIGIRGEWDFSYHWWLFGRAEMGFDVLDTFTPKGTGEDEDNQVNKRLLYGGINSDNLTATFGKNWSTYYQIAGMADKFSIFGGSAAGVYNARTDGGGTGTGRADDVLQIKLYTSSLKAIRIKPFNLNLQAQKDQPIPAVKGRHYGNAWGASAWLESQADLGIGLAYHSASVDDLLDPAIIEAGIDGDARAFAVSFRSFGERWYAALVLTRVENIETTDTLKYFNGDGLELYSQWEFKDGWWMIAGGNWLKPDKDDEDAGEYEVAYGVLGLRYSLDSFKRMLYAEYKFDHGTLYNGNARENEITIGIRWDFGY